MKLKSILAAIAAGVALASPLAAKAYEYNDGTYKWGFGTYENNDNEKVARLYSVSRVDGQKIEGAITFPATVSLTVTNELGYSKYDATTEKYNWVSTRPMKIETLTLPVEEIDWRYFFWEEKVQCGDWMNTYIQDDPLITSITIPEGVKYVSGLVGECLTNVTAVTFPSTVKQVDSCFGFCDKLASVTLPEDALIEGAFIGTPWAKAMGDFFVWNKTLIRYQGTASEVVIPEGVVEIGVAAFSPYFWDAFLEKDYEALQTTTNLTAVTLPSTLEVINYSAFYCCEKLAAISIPKGVYYIGSYAFECTALTSIELPAKLRSLGYGAFADTAISSLAIPEGSVVLSGSCYNMTNLTSVTLPSTAKSLDSTFEYCENLTSVTIPGKVEDLFDTFKGCSKLAAIDIPASVKYIDYDPYDYRYPSTFAGCTSLTSVTGGAGLKYVYSGAFGWGTTDVPFYDNAADGWRVLGPVAYGFKGACPESLTTPAGVKYVMSSVMNNAKNKNDLKALTLADGLETVASSAFSSCSNLGDVNLGNTVTNLGFGSSVFSYSVSNVTGGAALEVGRNALYSTKFKNALDDRVGSDDPFAFLGVGHVVLTYQGKCPADVVIPDDVTEIAYVFDVDDDESVKNITSITGGAGLRGHVPLYCLDNVKRIELTGKVSSVDVEDNYALEVLDVRNAKAYGLGSFYIDEYHATNLTKVAIGLSEEADWDPHSEEGNSLDGSVFMDCDKLQSLEFFCEGYKVTGFEGYVGNGEYEDFPNDLSTFKYIGYRTDFSEYSEGEYVDWSSLRLYPKFIKVVVDETSLEPFNKDVKSDYAGMLYDGEGKFAGTFEVAVKKATKTKSASATVKIVPLNGKKETIKGDVDANGNGQGALAGLRFGANGVTGSFTAAKNATTFMAEGASDITKSKDKAVKNYLKTLKGKTWGVVFSYSDDDGYGELVSDFANGYVALSVTMNNGGKAKVAGVLPDGTKVSVNAKMVSGADQIAIPVAIAKSKESFGFILWVDADGKAKELTDVTDWTGKADKVPFVQNEYALYSGDALEAAAQPVFMMNASQLPDALANSLTRFLPLAEEFTFKGGNATKWDFAKAPSIKAKNGAIDEEKLAADIAKGKTNCSGLKLKVNKKTGLVSGSFNTFAFDAKGKLKKTKVTVNGVMVDGIGYGAGTVKKIGALPVTIGNPAESTY